MILRAHIPMVNMSYEGNNIRERERAHSTLGERLLIYAEAVVSETSFTLRGR
jgi:hypothetical protein